MARPRLCVLFGGASEEHDVSVKSAREVARHLDERSYEPIYVGITRDGAWRLCDGPEAGWADEHRSRPAFLSPDRAVQGLVVAEDEHTRSVPVDVVLPVLHGRFGEDGTIQGLLELAGIPYVGCDVQTSVLCMDKELAYAVVRDAGVPVPRFRVVMPGDDIEPGDLEYPVFVKPARSGSSFGVTKVVRPSDLLDALRTARRFDSKLLIEAPVLGAEVGCAVLGHGDALIVGEPDRIELSHGFFRIHQELAPEAGSENATFVVPADIPPEHRSLVVDTAMAIYRALGCRGLARVDTFLREDGTVVLNEVNTFPGLTSYSRYPRMMAAAGLPLGEVLDRLIAAAIAGYDGAR